MKSYSELIKLKTFEERLDYLRKGLRESRDTFGNYRYLNQRFYRSLEWKQFRDYIITRDLGCDLGVPGYEILGRAITIHHINPLNVEDFVEHSDVLLDPENSITTLLTTHNLIHYGGIVTPRIVTRTPGDTKLW